MTVENTLSAIQNPALANTLIEQALADSAPQEAPAVVITTPSDNLVSLPGGYINSAGKVIKTAEVRELNGRDEEAIARANTVGRVLNLIVSRAVTKLGDEEATEGMLDDLLAGDRDALMLGIYKATFGPVAEIESFCSGCQEYKTIGIDLDKDIPVKVLVDPVTDRDFVVNGRKKEYDVTLPTGRVQKELNGSLDKTVAELTTVLLEGTVEKIDGIVVYNKAAIQNMGTADRRAIAKEISERNPGPQFDDLTVTCPDCDNQVVVPVSLGALFRL